MKNHIIRAFRTQQGAGYAPEYANHCLAVDITFAKSITDTQELSVRIYSPNYHFMGTDTVQTASNKTVRCPHFEVCSSEAWTTGIYHLFVCRDNHPKWFAELFIDDKSDEESRGRLEVLGTCSKELFFLDRLCTKRCWQEFDNLGFERPFAVQFIDRMHFFSFQLETQGWRSFPHLFVAGEDPNARKFASILADYITDDKEADCYMMSLACSSVGKGGWKRQVDRMKKSRVTLVDVSSIVDDERAMRILHKLGCFIHNHVVPDTTFVFYGSPESIEKMQEECSLLGVFFRNDTLFCLPFDLSLSTTEVEEPQEKEEEEEDDFEKCLQAFIEGNSNTGEESEVETDKEPVSSDEADTCGKEDAEDKEGSCNVPAEQRLQEMIGLKRVKDEVQEARLMALFTKERRAMQLDVSGDCRHHMLFLGNPGTGKTTVAKLIGEMYHDMGLLSVGHTIEANRTELVGKYIGQTEQNMKEAIGRARGGVLFIDEAYNLIHHDDSRDFGQEVINALLTVLSNPNPDMIVILAGYEDKMRTLLKFNSGLKDRFPLKFHFEDYTAGELLEIAHGICRQCNFELTAAADARLARLIEEAVRQRDEYFGNGRWVHNLIEHGVVKNMARRVMSEPHIPLSKSRLCVIEESDVMETEQVFLKDKTLKFLSPRRIGFSA